MDGSDSVSDALVLQKQAERWHALIDILYLTQVIWLYVFSALYPFLGLFYGIVLMSGSVSAKSKRIGRVCLILGIINLALSSLAVVGILVLSFTGLLAGLFAD
ncbi:MAG: hypothetical protein JSU73_02150 [candidate division WOR-3 bacterium]|nr:MAG: hypothetical protein JSU73_02150 [candidate division WOR-3 bacterium]